MGAVLDGITKAHTVLEPLTALTQCVFSDFDRDGTADVVVYPPSAKTKKSNKKGKLSQSIASSNDGPLSSSGSLGSGIVSGIAGVVVSVAAAAVFVRARTAKQDLDISERSPITAGPSATYSSI